MTTDTHHDRTTTCPLRVAVAQNTSDIRELREDFREMKGVHKETITAVGSLTNELQKLRLEIAPFIATAVTARAWTDRVLWALVSAALTTAVVLLGGKL
jgi:hypothetical protein